MAAATFANATVTLIGGFQTNFSGYDAPPVLTAAQTSGLRDALLVSNNPLFDAITLTYLGKEAAHINQFIVNGTVIFDNLATAPQSYGPFIAGTPLNFMFKDTNDNETVPNGGNLSAFASYVVLGTFDNASQFTPYRGGSGNPYDYVLGFNDGAKVDADYDDLVVGIRVSVVPEPEAYGLALAGMGVVGFAMRRRRGAS